MGRWVLGAGEGRWGREIADGGSSMAGLCLVALDVGSCVATVKDGTS
jgi:hypothetical protein